MTGSTAQSPTRSTETIESKHDDAAPPFVPVDDYTYYLRIVDALETRKERDTPYSPGIDRMTQETFNKLSASDRKHFAAFIANADNACDMVCDKDHAKYTDQAFKASMNAAYHALNRLNARPWMSACLGILAGIAAVAAVVFKWPVVAGAALAHVLAGGSFAAAATAATVAVTSAAVIAANHIGCFAQPKFAALKELNAELELRHTANMKAPG